MLSILSTVTYVWEICLELRSMAMSSAPLLHIGRRTESQQELDRTDHNLDNLNEEDNFDSDNQRLLDGRHFTRLRYHFGTYPNVFCGLPNLQSFLMTRAASLGMQSQSAISHACHQLQSNVSKKIKNCVISSNKVGRMYNYTILDDWFITATINTTPWIYLQTLGVPSDWME